MFRTDPLFGPGGGLVGGRARGTAREYFERGEGGEVTPPHKTPSSPPLGWTHGGGRPRVPRSRGHKSQVTGVKDKVTGPKVPTS